MRDYFRKPPWYIILNIIYREFDADLSAKGLTDDQISIVKGDEVELEIELTDIATGLKVRGADVVLEIGDDDFVGWAVLRADR